MHYLLNNKQQKIANVEVANTLRKRFVGWMFKKTSIFNEALYIPACNAIHTCFMRFPIDVVFVDMQFKILKVQKSVKPMALCKICIAAKGVFEFSEGFVDKNSLKVGDLLNLEVPEC